MRIGCFLPILIALAACGAKEQPRTLYVFAGSDSYLATTPAKDGANLPAEHGPWKLSSTIRSDDPRLKWSITDGRMLAEIRSRGYSLRRIVVTHEPITTVPEQP